MEESVQTSPESSSAESTNTQSQESTSQSSATHDAPTEKKFENPLTSRNRKSFDNPSGTNGKNTLQKEVTGVTQTPSNDLQMPTWEPNYKVKVLDKEHEIPESFRKLIKDADSEKEVRDIFERAYGLDPVKSQRDLYKDNFKKAQLEVQNFQSDVRSLAEDYQRGNLDGFFNKLGIPQEKLLQYVADKIKYSELPPEQQQAMDARKMAEERALLLEKEKGSIEAKFTEHQTNAIRMSLDSSLARSDIKSAADLYDARAGKPGAFREEVITRGEMLWHRNGGQVVAPEHIIREMISLYGLGQSQSEQPEQVQAAPNGAPIIPTAQNQQAGSSGQRKQTTMPNLAGRSNTPIKSKPKSLDEIRKLAKNF